MSTKLLTRLLTRNTVNHVSFMKFNTTRIKLKNEDILKKTIIPEPVSGMHQAAVLKSFNEPLVIENIEPVKVSNDNEVLIDVHYCALNGPDALLAKNNHTFEPALPNILGYEIAGKLVEVGGEAKKNGFKIGDKVVALNKTKFGGFKNQCIAEMSDIWKVQSSDKLLDSVCLLENYMTALIGLDKKANLQEDEMVLINVGLGGIGLAAVDIAVNVFRAQVIGVSASEEKAAMVRDKGAFASLKYDDKKLVKKIVEFADERDIEDVFDGPEGEKFKKMLDCFTKVYEEKYQTNMLRDDNFDVLVEHLSREGRMILAGFTAKNGKNGSEKKTDDDEDEKKNSFVPSGINLLKYKSIDFEAYREAGQDVLQYYDEGLIKPSYSLITGLYNINDALKCTTDMKCFGKVIIDLKHPDLETKQTSNN
ncbi:hypothetical protein HCN44_003300 [Aphidius gifuensis]|uniref:Enoyl reductase (ER) domain-containing protein n=1 Tax=Aphidius gifuensis TaxID=684658 RepID=A0A834XI85_APHGI|nr:quinone oxidoreductase-like protein 2 [Aphidius gifuensis]KAF7987538.1 hypothetical protein HCN44_003300 [Aphidius gifuensis]